MRVLVISHELIGSALCHKLQREGHEIKLYIEDSECKHSLEGIIPKSNDWEEDLSWVGKEGLIIFDDVGYGNIQDVLRKEGYRVVGGTEAGDRLELERGYFQYVLAEKDVQVAPSYDFLDAQGAIDFVRENPGPWVVKQNTHNGVLNYVGESKDDSDVIKILENYRSKGLKAHIQKKVTGIEVAVGRFFNGESWIGPVCVNHEHKRLCNGDVGPLTPEMGTVVSFVDDEPQIYKKTLAALEDHLRKIKYKGYIDINCIVDKDNIWPLEATARFGTPIIELQIEMLRTPLIDLLNSLADGTEYKPVFSSGYGVTVSIAVPPFPLKINDLSKHEIVPHRTEILFSHDTTLEDLTHVHFEEVSKHETSPTKHSGYYWAGTNGWVMHITGEAETISKAQEKVYKLIKKVILPMKFYRTDIGDRVKEIDLPLLRKWNLISSRETVHNYN